MFFHKTYFHSTSVGLWSNSFLHPYFFDPLAFWFIYVRTLRLCAKKSAPQKVEIYEFKLSNTADLCLQLPTSKTWEKLRTLQNGRAVKSTLTDVGCVHMDSGKDTKFLNSSHCRRATRHCQRWKSLSCCNFLRNMYSKHAAPKMNTTKRNTRSDKAPTNKICRRAPLAWLWPKAPTNEILSRMREFSFEV